MVTGILSTRPVWLLASGAALLFAASTFLTCSGRGRDRLPADILAHSRGSNPAFVLTQSSCNTLSFNPPCAAPGAACTTCGTNTYTNTTPGSNGGYTIKGNIAFGCGANWSGTCNAALQCVKTVGIGWCDSTPNVIVQ